MHGGVTSLIPSSGPALTPSSFFCLDFSTNKNKIKIQPTLNGLERHWVLNLRSLGSSSYSVPTNCMPLGGFLTNKLTDPDAVSATASPALQCLHSTCLCLTHTAVHLVDGKKPWGLGLEGLCASLQVAVIAFFKGSQARFGPWPPSRRPEKEEIPKCRGLCHVGEALSRSLIPGSVSETWRLWSLRSARLLPALRVPEPLVALLPSERSGVFKADWVCFSFLAWLPDAFHGGRKSFVSPFTWLITLLVPIIISLETMSRPVFPPPCLLRDQI